MKKLLLLFVAVLLTMTANAYDFSNNGIYYNLKGDGSLEVVGSSTTNVDIPSSITINGVKYRVTSIGTYAFNGRMDISYLSIPYSIKSIGEYAFMGCGSSITVNIADPESWCQMQLGNEHASPLSSAGKMLVHDIETTSFTVPETVSSIGAFTFYQCSCLKSLYIPSSVTSIGSSAFEDCDYLTSVTLNNGLKSIGGSAFEGCKRLSTLSIPSTVNTIMINAFKRCTAIKDVYCYATSVPTTDYFTFDDTPTGSATLHVPYNSISAYKTTWPWSDFKNVVSIETVSSRFEYGGIYYYIIDGNSVGVSIQKYAGDMIIPSTVSYNGITYIVTTIPSESDGYEPYTQLTSLVIPNSVTTIGSEAFGPCFSLKSLTIGSGVTSIGWGAFRGCTSLKTVVSKIQKPFAIKDVFLNLPSDAELIVPKGTKAAYQSTAGWNLFSKITESIDGYSLVDDKGLYYNIKGDGTLEVIGLASWTTRADILSSVTINGYKYNVTSIGDAAFEGRSDITYLSIPYSVTSIGKDAFKSCGMGLTVNIADPESWCKMELGNEHSSPLSSAGKMLVYDIETTSFSVPETVTSIGAFTFYQCSCITSLYIPSSVKTIGSSAFEDCDYLTSVTLSEGLQTIGGSAFEGCKRLTKLTIPSTVNKISLNAFRNCFSLGKVDCYAENVPTLDGSAFDGVFENAILRVPYLSENVYKLSSPWSRFGTITHLPIVTYVIDGEVYAKVQTPYGSAIVPPVVELREGYEFAWGEYPKTMPDEDVTINGSYIATAINGIKADGSDTEIYSTNGYKTTKLQRGLNIIRQSDGKVRKVLVR
jgi:hypothetical protein